MAHPIRPSGLPNYSDCERRGAAHMFPELIEAAGYELRHTTTGVASRIGTATHAGAEYLLENKMNDVIADRNDAVDIGIESLREGLEEGVAWDNTTANRNTAEKQVQRMVGSHFKHILPKSKPVQVEERLNASVANGEFEISGQKDQKSREPDAIRDLKTGVRQPTAIIQLGAYSLIERAHGSPVDSLVVDYIPRVRVTKDQPEPVEITYDVAAAEHAAMDTIDRVVFGMSEFEARIRHGQRPPEGAFLANPMSMLCGPKFCKAWGTNFCRLGREEK